MSVPVLSLESEIVDERQELLSGLRSSPKQVSPKFFYDAEGSRLFEEICELPEYYPTRTELRIMESNLPEIVGLIGEKASIIEFGSGASVKTRLLLSHLQNPAAYVPVEISREPLEEAARNFAKEFPNLEILPVCTDFTKPFELPAPKTMPEKNIIFFPGSTIGNFSVAEALELLRVMRAEAKDGGALLIGVDLVKSREILEAAYNDSAGVTAKFNLNLLKRLNREHAATFNIETFKHRAIFDKQHSRIEMQLISSLKQEVHVAGEAIEFDKNEYIVTEHSHKYSVDQFESMCGKAGFELKSLWTDPDALFSVQYLEAV